MNPNSGAIAHFENDDDARKAGYKIPLDDWEAAKLLSMNRGERRAYLASLRGSAKTEMVLEKTKRRFKTREKR
jgi:hypothetical protein